MVLIRLATFAIFLAAAALPRAAPLAPDQVPAPLRPWIPWVLHGHERSACPPAFDDSNNRGCVWSSRLTLEIGEGGAGFAQEVEVFGREEHVALPGDPETWPRDVRVGGHPVPVVAHGDRPSVRLRPGRFTITGTIPWREMPQNLSVPGGLGIVRATLGGSEIAAAPDPQGRLWLRERRSADTADSVSIRSFRLIEDSVPLKTVVRYELAVAGKPREIVVPFALLEGHTPVSLESPLPARIQADGSLSVQARAGTWRVAVGGRLMESARQLVLPSEAKREEIWSFLAHNEVRVATLEGPPGVDPKVAGVPSDWSAYPAFLVRPGTTLRINETRRGDAGGERDRLTLARSVWLDFDGGGYTMQDTLRGTVGRSWRMELGPPFTLGRVAIDAREQPLGRLASGAAGVEIRTGELDLQADSRLDSAARSFPASGWTADISGWSGTLHLPPGWRLLHVAGVDRVAGAWLDSWTLWDIFFVALIGAAAFRVLGAGAAVVLFAAMLLSWHTAGAPKLVWLGLIGAHALRAAIAEGRLSRFAARAGTVFALAIAVMLVPHAIDEIREALYPSLEFSHQHAVAKPASAPPARDKATNERRVARADKPAEAPAATEGGDESADALLRMEAGIGTPYRPYETPDPAAKSLTGPGIPTWSWRHYAMTLQGPVAAGHSIRIYVLPPAAGMLWSFAMVALLALALWRCSGASLRAVANRLRPVANGIAVLAIAAVLNGYADHADAQSEPAADRKTQPSYPVLPPASLLEELRERLTAAPDCMPRCAELTRLHVAAEADDVELSVEIHAQEPVAVPLPGQSAKARPVAVRGAAGAVALRRDDAGKLWASVPAGVSELVIRIRGSGLDEIPVALPMPPRSIATRLKGWTLSGIDARGLTSGSIQLIRERPAAESAPGLVGASHQLPPFVRVERMLSLGHTWTVRTRITRASPSVSPITVRVPLLIGEAITDSSVKVDGGEAILELGPDGALEFGSRLDPSARLALAASRHPAQSEQWSIDASTQWHVTLQGIPPVFQKVGPRWLPTWWPWPGETAELRIEKPDGIDGATLTFDAVSLRSVIGARSSAVTAELRLRSTRGGNHVLTLPADSELVAMSIDGATQPLRANNGRLAVPIVPGEHALKIDWRDPSAVSGAYRAPRLDLGTPAVNADVEIAVPRDRVVLLTRGPLLGPAVLLWGLVPVVVVVAFVLSRLLNAPLGVTGWMLLSLGLLQASLEATLLVLAWFVAFALRRRAPAVSPRLFNLLQCLLVALTAVSASALFWVLQQGLLGYPDMLIAGNGSNAFLLRWYEDRIGALTPEATVYSISVGWYRAAMLLWGLWLAASVLNWVRWAWQCYATGGYWRKTPPLFRRGKPKEAEPGEPTDAAQPVPPHAGAADGGART